MCTLECNWCQEQKSEDNPVEMFIDGNPTWLYKEPNYVELEKQEDRDV